MPAAPKMFTATDTFVMEMPDGSSLGVTKGAVFHSSHPLVKHDKANGAKLFQPIDDTAPASAKADGES